MDELQLRQALHRLLETPVPPQVQRRLELKPARRRWALTPLAGVAAACMVLASVGSQLAPRVPGVMLPGGVKGPVAQGAFSSGASSAASKAAAAMAGPMRAGVLRPAQTPSRAAQTPSPGIVHMAPGAPSGPHAPRWIRLPFGAKVKDIVAWSSGRHLAYHRVGSSIEVFVGPAAQRLRVTLTDGRTIEVPLPPRS